MNKTSNDHDPRLTAYALGELSRQEAEQLEKLLDSDVALQRELDSIQQVSQLLATGLGSENSYKLKPEQRAKVYKTGGFGKIDKVPSAQKVQWLRPLVVIAGAAAVVTVSFVAMNNISGKDTRAFSAFDSAETDTYGKHPRIQANTAAWIVSSDQAGDSAVPRLDFNAMPATDSENVSSSNDDRAADAAGGWEFRAVNAMTRVPLASADYSWAWIEEWAEHGADKPLSSELIRVEEIVNHFPYNAPADMMVGELQASVALVQCPWNAQHQLAVISIKNASTDTSRPARLEAGVAFSDNVSRYKLLGHQKTSGAAYGKYAPAVTELASGQGHVAIFELALERGFELAPELGAEIVSLSVRELPNAQNVADETRDDVAEKSLNVQFSDVTWQVAPQDSQFAIILATWAQLMTENSHSEPSSDAGVGLDLKLNLRKMIGKFESLNPVTDQQYEALKIIKKSLR